MDPELLPGSGSGFGTRKFRAGSGSGINSFGSATLVSDPDSVSLILNTDLCGFGSETLLTSGPLPICPEALL